MDTLRIILIDPVWRSRQPLQGQLEAIDGVDLVGVCDDYPSSVTRVSAMMPDLAIVVVAHDSRAALELIETLSRGVPDVAILTAGPGDDATLILQAMRAGSREFQPIPAPCEELQATIRRVCPRHGRRASNRPRGPQVTAVIGAAGGIGCTSTAVNLATTLAKTSRRDTVLADFDLLLGSLEESLAVPPDHSIGQLVRDLDGEDTALLKRWLPRHRCGLYVLPHPVSMEEAARLEPEALRRILCRLKETFPSVVIDCSKGMQASDFLALEMADVILVVLQLNLNCTRNTVRMLQYLRQFEGLGDKVKLVVNRINSPLSEISLKKAEELLKTPIPWKIPNATRLFRSSRMQGVPIDEVEEGAGSKAHGAFLEIARELQPFPVEPVRVRRRLFAAFR